MEELGTGRKVLFTGIMVVLTALIVLIGAEIMVRLTIPEETFWPVSNIYRPSEVPGVLYTYRPEFEGVAFGVDLKTNSVGFRSHEWRQEKSDDTFRIALIGDSHAFGFGVPSKRIMPTVLTELLEERYDGPAEVLNFGVNGYNTWQHLAVLQHLALDYDPDMVLLLPCSNDHKPPLRADDEGWLHWDGEDSNEKSRMVDKSIDKVKLDEVSWWMDKSRLYLYLKLVQRRQEFAAEAQAHRQTVGEQPNAGEWMADFPPGPVAERLAETVHEPFSQMLDILEERQVPVVVATFTGHLDYRQLFDKYSQERGVPVLELLKLFPETTGWDDLTDQFGLGWDDHLNAAAHERWAVALDALIAEQGIHPEATDPG